MFKVGLPRPSREIKLLGGPDLSNSLQRHCVNAFQLMYADSVVPENVRPLNRGNLPFPGYASQQPPPSRNTPLGSGRLQNSSKPSPWDVLVLLVDRMLIESRQ